MLRKIGDFPRLAQKAADKLGIEKTLFLVQYVVMKSLFLSALLILTSLATSISVTSCASNSGSSGDGTYVPKPSLSPVDATEQMRSNYRNEFR